MGAGLIFLLVAAAFLFILILAGNYFYNFSILRRKKEFLKTDPDLTATTSGVDWTSGREWLAERNYEDVENTSFDGLKLKGIYLCSPEPSDKTAILVHGYTSSSTGMAIFAKYYLEELGFNVLMPDCRGHGNSEGNYIGFGWHDRLDLLKWINYIIERNGRYIKIVLHGISMGGSTVLMASGENLPDNVKCIVSDCAYNSVEGILGYQMRRMFHLPNFPLMQITSLISRFRAGFFFKEASALNQVKKSTRPILFIHGSVDKFVPTEMVHELYDAASCEKRLVIFPGAGHGTSFWQDTERFKEEVSNFVEKHIN